MKKKQQWEGGGGVQKCQQGRRGFFQTLPSWAVFARSSFLDTHPLANHLSKSADLLLEGAYSAGNLGCVLLLQQELWRTCELVPVGSDNRTNRTNLRTNPGH